MPTEVRERERKSSEVNEDGQVWHLREEEEDTHHLRAPISMETWPCSSWFSLLFPEGVSCTCRFICRGLKRCRNRVASSHFIHCSLVSNMMRKEEESVKAMRENLAHTLTITPTIFKQPCGCKIKSGRPCVHSWVFNLPHLGKKEAISPRLPWRSQYAVTRSCSPEEEHKSFQNYFEGGSVIAGLGEDSMWKFGSWREFD